MGKGVDIGEPTKNVNTRSVQVLPKPKEALRPSQLGRLLAAKTRSRTLVGSRVAVMTLDACVCSCTWLRSDDGSISRAEDIDSQLGSIADRWDTSRDSCSVRLLRGSTEHQTDRAHGSNQHSDQGRCVEEAKEPILGPSPAHFRGHLTAPIDAH